jgi:hypothetical protein
MELFNKALFLSQQKIFALTHRRVYTLIVSLFQILNQFVLLFRKNVIEKSSMIWRLLPLVKINLFIQNLLIYSQRQKDLTGEPKASQSPSEASKTRYHACIVEYFICS